MGSKITASTEQKVAIKAQSFDSTVLDGYMSSILQIVMQHSGYAIGPVPLPSQEHQFLINTSQNIEKRVINNGAPRTKHKRMIYVFDETDNKNIVSEIMNLKLPNGVGVEIKAQE